MVMMTRREFAGRALLGAGLASVADRIVVAATTAGTCEVLQTPPFHIADAAHSSFKRESTAEDVTRGLDLSGKTALLTGSTAGIGLETMRVLVLGGAHVLALSRTRERGEAACATVMAAGARGRATPLVCEQTDFNSVVACSNAVKSMELPIDMLICNAGVNVPRLEQVYGIEKHFVVHHLSHFLLVNRLLDEIKAAPQGRVVMVASELFRAAPEAGIEFDNLSGERGEYDMIKMYGQSKLASGLFVREFARRFCATRSTANVLHPGRVAGTNITDSWKDDAEARKRILKSFQAHVEPDKRRDFLKTLAQGAATTCYVATNPALARVNGAYFEDCEIIMPEGHMQDDNLAAKLWDVSEELTRPYL